MRFLCVLTALMMILAGPTWAREADNNDDQRVRRAATILFAENPNLLVTEPFEVPPWLAQNLRLDQRGLKYTGRFGEKGEDRLVLRVRGPMLKTNRFGVMIDVRF